MSLNLTLNTDSCEIELRQVPQVDTMRILELPQEEIYYEYARFIMDYPYCSGNNNPTKKEQIMSRKEHLKKVKQYLDDHPKATWSYV